jgi:hypothetical protein
MATAVAVALLCSNQNTVGLKKSTFNLSPSQIATNKSF